MDADCAPFLFLSHYEFTFMKEILQNNPYKARKFNFSC